MLCSTWASLLLYVLPPLPILKFKSSSFPPEAFIAAILDILERYAAIGLYLLPRLHLVKMFSTVLAMNTLINSVRLQQRLHWLPPTSGLGIGGSPVGSPLYMSSHLNKCVDGIIAELSRFEGFINEVISTRQG